ncbi:MAG: hypothetical protein JOZ10_03255 [Acidobacteria bacterium]|nr:hypothetical protein [Acidobacteriota bacterium]MBV9146364.1 hypothetical protein [Acidobacteriota bacterium]MBV9437798.1 hypothetical protein [Acidobacteriota bacterium]
MNNEESLDPDQPLPEPESARQTNDLPPLPTSAIQKRIEEVEAETRHENKWNEFGRKAMDLEKLKRANRARRCSHVKSDGNDCKAPAWGNTDFCTFHTRSYDLDGARGMRISLLEDKETILLTLKQIMTQVINRNLDYPTASLLLRAAQIARSTLKPKRVKAHPKVSHAPQKPPAEPQISEEELDAEIAELQEMLARLPNRNV